VVLLAAVLAVLATARLGFWQLDRAQQKLALHERLEGNRVLPPLEAPDLASERPLADKQHYRRARLRGRWFPEHTVFLDNRQMNGVPGLFVVTPLQLEGRGDAILVQRGWAQRNFLDRAALPALTSPAGIVEVTGLIAPPPSRLYEFASQASGPIRQNIDVDGFAQELGLPLLPLSVLQADSAATVGDGLSRHWPIATVDVQKHYGYAFQWFALCALIAGLYVWFQIIRRARA
jgi:surfeit locus 1 family protein